MPIYCSALIFWCTFAPAHHQQLALTFVGCKGILRLFFPGIVRGVFGRVHAAPFGFGSFFWAWVRCWLVLLWPKIRLNHPLCYLQQPEHKKCCFVKLARDTKSFDWHCRKLQSCASMMYTDHGKWNLYTMEGTCSVCGSCSREKMTRMLFSSGLLV